MQNDSLKATFQGVNTSAENSLCGQILRKGSSPLRWTLQGQFLLGRWLFVGRIRPRGYSPRCKFSVEELLIKCGGIFRGGFFFAQGETSTYHTCVPRESYMSYAFFLTSNKIFMELNFQGWISFQKLTYVWIRHHTVLPRYDVPHRDTTISNTKTQPFCTFQNTLVTVMCARYDLEHNFFMKTVIHVF